MSGENVYSATVRALRSGSALRAALEEMRREGVDLVGSTRDVALQATYTDLLAALEAGHTAVEQQIRKDQQRLDELFADLPAPSSADMRGSNVRYMNPRHPKGDS